MLSGQVLTSSTFGHLKGLSDVGLKQLCHGTCQTMLEGLCGEAWGPWGSHTFVGLEFCFEGVAQFFEIHPLPAHLAVGKAPAEQLLGLLLHIQVCNSPRLFEALHTRYSHAIPIIVDHISTISPILFGPPPSSFECPLALPCRFFKVLQRACLQQILGELQERPPQNHPVLGYSYVVLLDLTTKHWII